MQNQSVVRQHDLLLKIAAAFPRIPLKIQLKSTWLCLVLENTPTHQTHSDLRKKLDRLAGSLWLRYVC